MAMVPDGRVKPELPRSRDVAIVGIGVRFPDACSPGAFWDNLMEKRTSIREISRPRWPDEMAAHESSRRETLPGWGALLDDVECFDASFFEIPAEEARLIDPQERLLYQGVYHALQDAGLDPGKLWGSKTGMFVGYEHTEYEQLLRRESGGMPGLPSYGSSSPAYYLANRASFRFNFNGPSEALALSYASSAVAINRAYYSLLNHECDLAIAAGVSLSLFADDYQVAIRDGKLSREGACDVFDETAGGFTRGEGVGVVVLKRMEEAGRDRSNVYAIIKACQQSHRGRSGTLPVSEMIAQCCKRAGVDPLSIRYIEVDGCVPKAGDSAELDGIRSLLARGGANARQCALGSLKGNIGHLEPASAVASVIKVALAMSRKRFPPTLRGRGALPSGKGADSASPVYIAEQAISFDDLRDEARTAIRAGVNSFAHSGCGVHILLEEPSADPAVGVGTESSSPELFVLSGKEPARLLDYLGNLADWLTSTEAKTVPLQSVIHTLQLGREAMRHRVAIIASSKTTLAARIRQLAGSNLQELPSLQAQDIFYGESSSKLENPLAGLITAELVESELEHSARLGQWRRIAVLWTSGIAIRWDKVWENRPQRFVSLPGYPFARQRHWVEVDGARQQGLIRESSRVAAAPANTPHLENLAGDRSLSKAPLKAEEPAGTHGAEKIQFLLKRELSSQLKVPVESIDVDANYLELGVTSLGIAKLVQTVNRTFAARLSPSVVFDYPDIRRFSAYLEESFRDRIDSLDFSSTTRVLEKVFWQEGSVDKDYHRTTF